MFKEWSGGFIMEKVNQKKKHKPSSQNLTHMEVELGDQWDGDAKRVVDKVETRVKNTASRYGFCETDDEK